MTNQYYNATSVPGTRTKGKSAPIRSEYAAIEAGFDEIDLAIAGKADLTGANFTGPITVPPVDPDDPDTSKAIPLATALAIIGPGGDLLPDLLAQVQALAAQVEAAKNAVYAGLIAGLWVSGTTYEIGALRFSPANGLLYRRLTAGAGTDDPGGVPGDTVNWMLQTLAAPTLVPVAGTTQTGERNIHHEMRNAAASEYTLPLSPAVGDTVWVGFTNGLTDSNFIRRNGQLIMGYSQDMLVDIAFFACMFRFVGGATGWRIYA